MSEDHHLRVEQTASAVEDLVHMGVIKLDEKKMEGALLSPKFA